MHSEMTTGPDLRLRRTAMHITASALAERLNVSLSWVSRRESLAVVKEADAKRYLSGLATFGTVPTVEVRVA